MRSDTFGEGVVHHCFLVTVLTEMFLFAATIVYLAYEIKN